MSGLEVIGIAASIIQIADLGTKLSVKLFSFYRQIQNADKAIQHLSSDVALTCAILRELGDSLTQDEQSKLCSPEAHLTAKQMLRQCEEVLQQIQNMIDESQAPCKSRWQQATNKLRNVLNEPDVNLVRGNLERLKSTMLLLLNVVMFAGQIRNNHVPDMLNEQRNLIEILLKEKKTDQVTTISMNSTGWLTSMPHPTTLSFAVRRGYQPQQVAPSPANQEVQDYNSLIRAMLREIDGCKSKIEKSRHSRIRDGVLNVHSSEIVHFQRSYGPSIFQCFDDSIFETDFADVTSAQCTSNPAVPSYILDTTTVQETTYVGNSSEFDFAALCSPALQPCDSRPTRENDRTGTNLTRVSASREKIKSQHSVIIPSSQRSQRPPIKGNDKISPDTAYVSTKSKYQHILDETRVPGVFSPEITPTTLTSKRTSQKIAERARRNRINNALQELEALMPPTFIQDQKSQRLAGSSVTVIEAEKPDNHFFGKAFIVETAIQYINELRRCLEGSDTSARTFVPAALIFERGPNKIQEQGRRNRINVALKEIESIVPSEFIQARFTKDNAISGVKSEGDIDDKFVTQAHSKASVLEMANDYIRELQRNLENTSETLALRLMPLREPSPNGRTETPGKESMSGPTSAPDDQKEVDSGSASKPTPPIDGDAISDAKLPSPQGPLSLNNPVLYKAETRGTLHEESHISQSNVVDSLPSSPRPPANAVSVKDGGKAVAGQVETQHSSSKYEIRPPPVDLWETSQTPNSREDFGTFLDLNEMQFQRLDSWVESPRDDWLTRPLLESYSGIEDDDLQGDTVLPNLGKDVKGQVQGHTADGLAWKPHRPRHKRTFSTIDDNSPSPMIFEPLIEKHQKRSENITSQDIPLGTSNQEFSEDNTDRLWPNSLEKALERWTNLKQNEINTDIFG